MNLALWLARSAEAGPRRPALFAGQVEVADYGTFDAQARAVAAWLIGQGVGPGDRIALFMKNTPDYLIIFYGIWYAGAAVVPINAKLHARETAYILEDSDARIVFCSPGLETGLGDGISCIVAPSDLYRDILTVQPVAAVVPRASVDLAWLFYTSGTTGKPKGVIITHGMALSMALCYHSDVDPVSPDDAALYAAPLSHGAGLYNLMHVQMGARHVCPASGGFEADEILDLAAHFGRVHMFAAPTMVKRVTDHARASGRHGDGLRTIVYAGGPMYNADIIDAVDHFGPVFAQIYGQGECPMGITAMPRQIVSDRNHPDWRARLGSVGRAQSAVEVQIGDAQGHPLPVGEAGEIMVRGQTVMPGYWNNPEATAKTLINGWLMTGDVGVMDAEGYLTLHDRSKDMIITGGSNVYPREVEEVLLEHDQVIEASVIGRPHPDWGEEVIGFIVGTAPEAELDALCLSQIARFKRPKAYVRLEALPKNNYGKVLKTELRELLKS
ncbi:class I adenylate-forming enzyme family protein [Roseobacter sp. GAI101]|uniref:class I adenylate-forming enzyme family protein n=1 Tax=Roseobacter sp. (strain GAI101) TaxID=391589 RepID=UPI00018720BD|nr:AMP-binding protein [Roseobacter sp. GAI101]EEB84560.1 AMP-binding domain protein [Roseobacter sp. GAI101]